MELHFHAEIISRGKGGNAVRAASYFARCEMTDERTGETFDFSHKPGLVFEQLFMPKGAPEWTADEGRFWNELHRAEKRNDAQLARSIDIALPHELTPKQMELWTRDFVRDNFLRNGYAVQASIHEPSPEGNDRNWHLHLLIPLRQIDGKGFAPTKERTTKAEKVAELKHLRERTAVTLNRALERYGHDKRIEHLSFEERGLDQEPEQRCSPGEIALARREGRTPPHDLNREILERRTSDLADDAARSLRAEMARDENRQIDRAIFELGRTDPTLAATFIKPSADPIRILLHDDGRTLELLGGGIVPEAPEKATTEAETVLAPVVAEKPLEPVSAPGIEPTRPVWKDLRPKPAPRPSIPFLVAILKWTQEWASRVVEAAAELLHQREPRTMTKLGDPEFSRTRELIDKTQPQLPGASQPVVNLSRQQVEPARQHEIPTPQPAPGKDIAADRQEAARRHGDKLEKKPEPKKRPARSLNDDPLWQDIKRQVAAEKAAAALRKDLKRDHELDGGLEL